MCRCTFPADQTLVHFHFSPTHASWLNQVEVWFSILKRRALDGASHTSSAQVRGAIDRFVAVQRDRGTIQLQRMGLSVRMGRECTVHLKQASRRLRVAATLAAAAILVPLAWGAAAFISPFPVVASGGFTYCYGDYYTGQKQAGEMATSSSQVYGARATIEGQSNPLCAQSIPYVPSVSWEWSALGQASPVSPNNIVQVGYGHCTQTNNGIGLGSLCNGNFYYYWAWGSDCGSGTGGSGGTYGPIPIRIGSARSNPPSTVNYQVVREVVGGTAYYDGYVGGSLLAGYNALGVYTYARVAASSVCWDGTARAMAWFGETVDSGDSMGGWVGSTRNHLDYTSLQYTVNLGWGSTSLHYPQACDVGTGSPYSCTIAGSDHIYIDTNH
jgi:hypothetical protein